jgi:biopolymer transport protein ExbD
MAFASFDSNRSAGPMAEINMVPLIDVMLVLLVIFIVTAPLLTNTVKLDLPKADASATSHAPDKIEFAIDALGNLYWNNEIVTRQQASGRFAEAAARQPQPELHVRADGSVAYHYVAQTLADASKAGLNKIGFISVPEDR